MQEHWARVAAVDRINVIGLSGSGKSTFAKALARAKGVPYIELDRLYWKADWQESTDAEFFPAVDAAVSQPAWVLDGNYSRTVPIKWPRTQLVILLEFPFPLTLWRVTRRCLHRAATGEELWPGTGNRESWRRLLFSRESMVWWVISRYATERARHADPAFFRGYGDFHLLRIRRPRDLEAGLAIVSRACAGARAAG